MYTAGGGVTNDTIIDVVQKAMAWRWEGETMSPWEQKNAKKLRIITTDGVGIHINPVFLRWLLDHDIRLLLRCPYSSSKTQPEDLISLWYLKNNAENGFYKAKQEQLTAKYMASSGREIALDDADILDCVKP